ncbi:DUF3500 domain-containing protein [Verrucomicrobiales bacterium]|nr:DUF3500 domain-containing protein [Verrucomicrobiales bacterium]
MKTFAQLPVLLAVLALGSLSNISAHPGTAKEMAKACEIFLQDLSDHQKAKAVFDWKDTERVNWHFIPRDRKGLALKDMDDSQRALAHALIVTGLSHQGYSQALQVMSLEKVLFLKEDNNPTRDPGKYYVSVFGTPDPTGTWGWRLEGHHLALNYTVVKGQEISVTPSFYATNPGKVLEGPRKGVQVLAGEENVARKLVRSLTDEQKSKVIFSEKAPRDILSSADRNAKRLEPVGISYSGLNDDQKKQLKSLINVYLKKQRPAIHKRETKRLEEAGWDKVTFAWAGGTKKGEGHYYRVQSPHFLLEYANTQNDANHVHAVYRDLNGDFGDDVLKKHFAEEHK